MVVVIVAVVICQQSAKNELKINEEKKQKTMDKKCTFENDEKIRKRKRPWNEGYRRTDKQTCIRNLYICR